jgi:hypothetical protein
MLSNQGNQSIFIAVQFCQSRHFKRGPMPDLRISQAVQFKICKLSFQVNFLGGPIIDSLYGIEHFAMPALDNALHWDTWHHLLLSTDR